MATESFRVIHFANWMDKSVPEQFERWLTLALCKAIRSGPRATSTEAEKSLSEVANAARRRSKAEKEGRSTRMPKWRRLLKGREINKCVN